MNEVVEKEAAARIAESYDGRAEHRQKFPFAPPHEFLIVGGRVAQAIAVSIRAMPLTITQKISANQPETSDMMWLSSQRCLSLAFYGPVYGDDDDQAEEWRVTRESGSINDREWDVVGRGQTPVAAVSAARAALSPTSTGGEAA